ncbi:MAG: hypothetical protein M1836_007601 [Candelina mexicana]|nr:MAG: hypothetical protein M1836_007601 [Candelina mexicana]
MAITSLSTRLRYLNDSAYMLATTSPATSAYLMSQHRKVASEHDLTIPEARSREVCGACGNIMIIGWSSHTYAEAGPEKLPKSIEETSNSSNSKEPHTGMTMIYECRICNSNTKQDFRKHKIERQPQHRKGAPESVPSQTPGIPTTRTKPASVKLSSVNGDSKRRAKARKQSGLQAMLARARADDAKSYPSRGFGLDLMDLMKSNRK